MTKQILNQSDIKSSRVRLVMPEGAIIIDKTEAFRRSNEEGLDLILVQDGDLPVVKICDATKIEYNKQKNTNHNRAKKVKHVQIGPHTAEHDLSMLASRAIEFIKNGHPVVLQMEIKGRDRMFSELIKQQVEKFISRIPEAKPGKITYSNNGSTAVYTVNLT